MDRVIDRAPQLTTGQLRARIRQLCFAVDPDESKSRYEQALEERRVVREATEAGTANLMILDAPPDIAAEASNLINQIAIGLKTRDEPRTLDQLRTDVALDLLSGRANGNSSGRGTIDIHVDLATLAELSDAPGDLAGYGPVIADIARQVAVDQKNAEWRWTATDPGTGMVVHNGTTHRRPTADQTRHVESRNRTCVYPGAGCQPAKATSTTPNPGPKPVTPRSTNSARNAGTTIAAATSSGGRISQSQAATTSGPAASASNTPPAADHPHSHWITRQLTHPHLNKHTKTPFSNASQTAER